MEDRYSVVRGQDPLIVRINYNFYNDAYSLFFFRRLPDGGAEMLDYFSFRRIEPGSSLDTGRTIEVPASSLRVLMQDLWDAGIRPANYDAGSADRQVVAMQNHIEDLRTVLNKFLDRLIKLK